jgi:hypothetical protein
MAKTYVLLCVILSFAKFKFANDDDESEFCSFAVLETTEFNLFLINPAPEECRLQGCGAVWALVEPMFQRNVLPPSSRWKEAAR